MAKKKNDTSSMLITETYVDLIVKRQQHFKDTCRFSPIKIFNLITTRMKVTFIKGQSSENTFVTHKKDLTEPEELRLSHDLKRRAVITETLGALYTPPDSPGRLRTYPETHGGSYIATEQKNKLLTRLCEIAVKRNKDAVIHFKETI